MVISASSILSSTNKISTSKSLILFFLLFMMLGQAEEKCRAFIKLCFCPKFAAMPFNNPFYQGQANTGTFKFILAVQALKNAEKLVGIFHIKANAVVFYKIG